ncbi:MAG TPA: M67 family metallopeptidase [Verrucomicrobiae bacterium]|nr:M67 family metallopeptidase [Verrucomicrobiae bacterium]
MPDGIRILRACLITIESHAGENPAVECCGLLAGRDGTIERAMPALNAAGNPATAYEIAPENIFRMLREIRAERLELLGIYHSHPRSENVPSPRDLELAGYPDTAYFIFSPAVPREKSLRAFSIRDGRAAELAIEIV